MIMSGKVEGDDLETKMSLGRKSWSSGDFQVPNVAEACEDDPSPPGAYCHHVSIKLSENMFWPFLSR